MHFHQGSAERVAEIILLGGAQQLAPGQSSYAQLRLDIPVLVLPGDRFVLRRLSPVLTIGGGTVLDTKPARHKGNGAAALPAARNFTRRRTTTKFSTRCCTPPRANFRCATFVARTRLERRGRDEIRYHANGRESRAGD